MVLSVFDLKPVIDLTDEQFYQLCRANPDVKFERDATGKILIMPPTGGTTGNRNSEIGADFVIWNRQTQLGICFDSSAGFRLPNGATRSPDVAWIERSRWEAIPPAQQERFPPIAPDFVLELMSPSDTLEETQAKLQEYIENGVRLGWLINREIRYVEIYRPGQAVEGLFDPTSLSGEDVLPGFVLDLAIVW